MSKTKSSNEYEKFVIVKMNRAQIKNAPYNPRTISDKAKAKLKANLKKVGLIEPLIVNKRTGNLVSGHQRLSQLDDLIKKPDYEMTIALVDMDEKTEKEQNIFMNNTSVMGDFDPKAMQDLIKEIDWKNTGLELPDLQAFGVEFSIEQFQAMPVSQQSAVTMAGIEETQQLLNRDGHKPEETYNGKLAGLRAEQQENHPEMTYFVVTFETRTQKNAFLAKIGLEEDDKYLTGAYLDRFVNSKTS